VKERAFQVHKYKSRITPMLRGYALVSSGAKTDRAQLRRKNALREARRLNLVTVQERRRRGQKSLTNLVRIVSPEWMAWIRGKKATDSAISSLRRGPGIAAARFYVLSLRSVRAGMTSPYRIERERGTKESPRPTGSPPVDAR
jgi:hypothetical protein